MENSIQRNCPNCGCGVIGLLEDSTDIMECDGCGAEWYKDTGEYTLDPNHFSGFYSGVDRYGNAGLFEDFEQSIGE